MDLVTDGTPLARLRKAASMAPVLDAAREAELMLRNRTSPTREPAMPSFIARASSSSPLPPIGDGK